MKWFRSLSLWIALPFVLFLALIPLQTPNRLSAAPPTTTPPKSSATIGIMLSHDHTADLYTLNDQRTSLQLIAKDIIDSSPAWSPDHKRIAAAQTTSRGDRQLVLMNANGSNRRVIFTLPNIRTILWSPDGTRIAFDVDNVLADGSFAYLIDTTGRRLQTWGPFTRIFLAKWLSGSDEIAYTAPDVGCDPIYAKNVASLKERFLVGCDEVDESRHLTQNNAAPCSSSHIRFWGLISNYSWSTDGQNVAVALDQTGGFCVPDMMIVGLYTGNVQPIPYKVRLLTWSPDNKSIAFIEDTPDALLCVVGINGSAKRCGPSMKDPVSGYSKALQMKWLSDGKIALVMTPNPEADDESQICVITADTFVQHCLTGVLSGTAHIVDSW